MKFCRKCEQLLPLTSFSKDSRKKDGLQTYCKSCKSVLKKAWDGSNKEHRAGYKKRYDSENKDKKANWDRTYRQKHQETLKVKKARYVQENKEAHRARGRRWARLNPHKKAADCAAYRAGKRTATLPWGHLEKIPEVYRKAREMGCEVDHIVPLNSDLVCGLHVWFNLQLLPPKVNASKGNKYWPDMPEEVLYGNGS